MNFLWKKKKFLPVKPVTDTVVGSYLLISLFPPAALEFQHMLHGMQQLRAK